MTQPRIVSRTLSVSLVVVAMLSFQASASIAKQLFPVVGPQGAAGLRLLFGAAMLLAVFRPWRSLPQGAAWRPILAYGIVLGVMNQLFYMALATIPLGLAVALEFSGPLAVAMIASRRPIDFLWVALAVAGLALILRPDSGAATGLDPAGVGFALGAGVCWALYIWFGQRAGGAHGIQATALGATIAALIAVPMGAWHLVAIHAGPSLFTPQLLAAAAVLGLLGTALPYVLEMVALGALPTRTFGTLMSLEPAVGALAGLVLLHQVLTLTQGLAIAAVVAASIGATVTIKSDRPVIPGDA